MAVDRPFFECPVCGGDIAGDGHASNCDVRKIEPGGFCDWQLSEDAKRRITEINRHIVRQPGIR